MTRYTTTDVLICGAGATGLTLAIELARHGIISMGYKQEKELRMLLFWEQAANHYGYFSYYKVRTGICWPTKPAER
ncbi:hypothetical protein S828_23000 [Salmonella enterica]|nr:hypothetical protein [Salmonella enterica]EAY4774319.1 hypothetical protein [Salmonella enterica]